MLELQLAKGVVQQKQKSSAQSTSWRLYQKIDTALNAKSSICKIPNGLIMESANENEYRRNDGKDGIARRCGYGPSRRVHDYQVDRPDNTIAVVASRIGFAPD